MSLEGVRSKKLEKICRKVYKKYRHSTLEESIDIDRIVCLKVHGALNARWIGRIHKVAFPYDSFINYDYIIQFNWEQIQDICKNKKQLKSVVTGIAYHELRHVAPDDKLNRHDIEDFTDFVKIRKMKSIAKIPNLLDISKEDFVKLLGDQ